MRVEFQRGGGVATVSLGPSGVERLYRFELFCGGDMVSVLVSRDELRRFAAAIASYTSGTPPTGTPP